MKIAELEALAEAAKRCEEFGGQAEVDLLNAINPAMILKLCRLLRKAQIIMDSRISKQRRGTIEEDFYSQLEADL